jgi:hypothetical protein
MSDTVRLPIGGELELVMPKTLAKELVAQWSSQLGLSSMANITSVSLSMSLPDDHPLWGQHDGLDGHRDEPEWNLRTDVALAETFYQPVSGKAKVFLDLLIDNPGRQLAVDELCRLSNGTFTGSRSIAGALNGLSRSQRASGRRYPFYWWAGNQARYAMKKSVAELFRFARANVGT